MNYGRRTYGISGVGVSSSVLFCHFADIFVTRFLRYYPAMESYHAITYSYFPEKYLFTAQFVINICNLNLLIFIILVPYVLDGSDKHCC